MAITIEQLDSVLSHKNIDLRPVNEAEGFDRNRYFSIFGVDYRIEWYVNMCYLFCGGLMVLFYDVKQSGTWPNSSKLNLQFYDEDQEPEVVAVLPIEDY